MKLLFAVFLCSLVDLHLVNEQYFKYCILPRRPSLFEGDRTLSQRKMKKYKHTPFVIRLIPEKVYRVARMPMYVNERLCWYEGRARACSNSTAVVRLSLAVDRDAYCLLQYCAPLNSIAIDGYLAGGDLVVLPKREVETSPHVFDLTFAGIELYGEYCHTLLIK